MRPAKVLLEVETLDDGTFRVWYRGIYEDGYYPMPPATADGRARNLVHTWLNTPHDVRAFHIDPELKEVRDEA